jgi:hypothetical protein
VNDFRDVSPRSRACAEPPPALTCTAGTPVAASRSPSADTKTATYPGRSAPPLRFGAGAARKSPRVPVGAEAIGVAITRFRRVARPSAAVSPGAPLRSIPGTAIGGKPVASVAGR